MPLGLLLLIALPAGIGLALWVSNRQKVKEKRVKKSFFALRPQVEQQFNALRQHWIHHPTIGRKLLDLEATDWIELRNIREDDTYTIWDEEYQRLAHVSQELTLLAESAAKTPRSITTA